MKSKAPNMKVYTKSKDWEIDPPDVDPEYSEPHWEAVFVPGFPVELVAALRFLGCKVDDPQSDFGAWTVRGSPAVPDWLNDVTPQDIPSEDYATIFSARLVMRGPEALHQEKQIQKMTMAEQFALPVAA
jgi:hypothetical protein